MDNKDKKLDSGVFRKRIDNIKSKNITPEEHFPKINKEKFNSIENILGKLTDKSKEVDKIDTSLSHIRDNHHRDESLKNKITDLTSELPPISAYINDIHDELRDNYEHFPNINLIPFEYMDFYKDLNHSLSSRLERITISAQFIAAIKFKDKYIDILIAKHLLVSTQLQMRIIELQIKICNIVLSNIKYS